MSYLKKAGIAMSDLAGGGGMRPHTKPEAERGQALVEFALTVPILLFLVFGIIDLARLIFSYTQVMDASRQGVRYGIVEGLDVDNYQYLDCAAIRERVRETPGLVPSADLDITITYEHPVTGATLASCGTSGTLNTSQKNTIMTTGAVLVVQVEGEIAPVTPVLALFDDTWSIDYTSKRTIANEGAYYTDEWPVGPPIPQNLTATADCDTGWVSFTWDPLSLVPEQIEIRNSLTNDTVVIMTDDPPNVATQYAYCQKNMPYGGNCGTTIPTPDGYGMWYMVVIHDGLEGTSSGDATADTDSDRCGGGGGGGGGGGTASVTGLVFYDKNGNGKKGGGEGGLSGVTVRLIDAGEDGALGTGDDVTLTTNTDVNGNYSFTNLTIPSGQSTQDFRISINPIPAGKVVTTTNQNKILTLADNDAPTEDFGLDDQ
jgi:hypothetical protein